MTVMKMILISLFLFVIIYFRVIHASCGNGQIRLVDGDSQYEGRVEMCEDNQWLRVCASTFAGNSATAIVICRQLRYPTDYVFFYDDLLFDTGIGGGYANGFFCLGYESFLLQCIPVPLYYGFCIYDIAVGCFSKLRAVDHLMAEYDGSCCTNITWSPPSYTQPGVPILSYNVYISNIDGRIMEATSTVNTELTYCPVESGEYIISVGAVNRGGEGNIAATAITYPQKYNISGIEIFNQSINELNQWIIDVNITIKELIDDVSILMDDVEQVTMRFINTELNKTITTDIINFNTNDSLMATFMTNDTQLNDKHYTFTLDIVIVECELIVRSTIQNPISFFDVINITVVSDSAPHPLFACHFVSGSMARGCHIRLLQNKALIDTVNITRSNDHNTETASGGFTDSSVSPGHYTVKVYDINRNGMVFDMTESIYIEIVVTEIKINFYPSSNIAITDTAMYICSSNHSIITIQWYFNSTIRSTECAVTSVGIFTTGVGTTNSTLIIPGHLTQYNDTLIECHASGYIGSVLYGERRSDTLLIQGKLSAVGNLKTDFDGSCCTNITWSPPYTLSGVPILKYNINISNGPLMEATSTVNTELTYCPVDPGEYIISLGAVNKVGEGNIAVTAITYPQKYNISGIEIFNQSINELNQWIIDVNITIEELIDNVSILMDDVEQVTMRFINTELNKTITTDIINFTTTDSLMTTFVTNDTQLNDNHYTFTLDIILVECGLIVRSTIQNPISFFDVINITVVSDSAPHPLFTCHFVSGSMAHGCHIRLLQNKVIQTINITRDCICKTASGGFTDSFISSGNYTIYVYDINSDNSIAADPAYSRSIQILKNSDDIIGLATGLPFGVMSSVITIIIIIVIIIIILIKFRKRSVQQQSDSLQLNNLYSRIDSAKNIYTYNLMMIIDKDQLKNLESSGLLATNDRLRLLDCIGQGEFGVVYKGHLINEDGMLSYVAVKTLKGSYDQNDVSELVTESLYMKHLSHLNVMGLIGVCIDAGPAPLVILPYMAGGSLLSYLKRNRDNIVLAGDTCSTDEIQETEVRLLSMCLQIARGMKYISSKSMIHRDLAARNCMIDHQGIIKVADFGLSRNLYEKEYFRQDKTEGTKLPIKWMAMESITDRIFSGKTDVWSFGVTCWEVFSGGKEPYGGINPMSILSLLEQGQRLNKPTNNVCSTNTYESLMMSCWSSSPDERPAFDEIVMTIENSLTSMGNYLDFNEFTLDTSAEDVSLIEESTNFP